MNTKEESKSEVREIARMQTLIDRYELFISSLYVVIKSENPVNYPIMCQTELDDEMNFIFKWTKEHKDK